MKCSFPLGGFGQIIEKMHSVINEGYYGDPENRTFFVGQQSTYIKKTLRQWMAMLATRTLHANVNMLKMTMLFSTDTI